MQRNSLISDARILSAAHAREVIHTLFDAVGAPRPEIVILEPAMPPLKAQAVAAAKAALETLLASIWDAESDPQLVEDLAQDIAETQLLIAASSTQAQRDFHARNLDHCLATLETELAARTLAFRAEAKALALNAAKALIGALAGAAVG